MPVLNPLKSPSFATTSSAATQALAKRPALPSCEDAFVSDDLRTRLRVALEARDLQGLKNLTSHLDRPTSYRLLNSPCDRGLDASVEPGDAPEMPICMAADSGSLPVVLHLLRRGALPTLGDVIQPKVEKVEGDDEQPRVEGDDEQPKVEGDDEAAAEAPRQTLYPVYFAAKQGHTAVLDALEQRGCPMGSVLMALNGKVAAKTVAWLVASGHSGSALSAAMERAIIEQRCAGVQTLVKVGLVDLDRPAECDPHGWLHYALQNECWEAAKKLIDLGAPVAGLAETATTEDLPLQMVTRQGNLELADKLLNCKAPVSMMALQGALESSEESGSAMFGTLYASGVSLAKQDAVNLFGIAYERKLAAPCALLSVHICMLTGKAGGKLPDSDYQEMRAQCMELADDCRNGKVYPFEKIFTGEMTADLGGYDLVDTMPSNHWAAKSKAKLKHQMKRAVEQVKIKPRDKQPTQPKQRKMIGGPADASV
jgi:hypothetical protein